METVPRVTSDGLQDSPCRFHFASFHEKGEFNMRSRVTQGFFLICSTSIDYFTVLCQVTWRLSGGGAGGGPALIQTCLLLSRKCT